MLDRLSVTVYLVFLCEDTNYYCAANHRLKSVVREIRTLRSVGEPGRVTAS